MLLKLFSVKFIFSLPEKREQRRQVVFVWCFKSWDLGVCASAFSSAELPSVAQTRLQDVIRDVVVNANMWNVKAGDSVSETKTEQSASSASFIRSNPVFS